MLKLNSQERQLHKSKCNHPQQRAPQIPIFILYSCDLYLLNNLLWIVKNLSREKHTTLFMALQADTVWQFWNNYGVEDISRYKSYYL